MTFTALQRTVCTAFAAVALMGGPLRAAASPLTSESVPAPLAVVSVAPVVDEQYVDVVHQLLRGARHSMRLMLYQVRYYDEYPDSDTNHFLVDLIGACERGVRVEIVVDTGNWNPSNKNEYNLDFVDRLTTAGARIWEDAPDDVSHQKVILVDDALVLVSSHNWSHYSLRRNHEAAVLIESPELNTWFRGYFSDLAAKGSPRANVPTEAARPEAAAPAHGPGLRLADLTGLEVMEAESVTPLANRSFYPGLFEQFLQAKESITVIQRSLQLYDRPSGRDGRTVLPGEPPSLTNALAVSLINAAKRGLNVRVILDRSSEHDNTSNDETAEYLLENGVKVYHDDLEKQTHAKMLMVDSDKTVIGSTNWTRPALEDGNEASVLVVSPSLNKYFQGFVAKLLESGGPYPPPSAVPVGREGQEISAQ